MTARVLHRDRGSASVGLMLLVVIAIAGSGLIFDGARYLAAERHASNTAEAAARAAVENGSPSEGLREADARQAAISRAASAGVPASGVVVSFPSRDTVVVTITERRPTTFVRFGGAPTIIATAEGRARLEYS